MPGVRGKNESSAGIRGNQVTEDREDWPWKWRYLCIGAVFVDGKWWRCGKAVASLRNCGGFAVALCEDCAKRVRSAPVSVGDVDYDPPGKSKWSF